MAKSEIRDFTQGSITRPLAVFAAPLFLSNLLQVVYNMADMMIVGNVAGQTGLSAVSVGGDVANFMTFVGMGFANAGQVIMSQYIGAGRRDLLSRFVSTMFTFLMLCAAAISVVCILLRDPILRLMNVPEEAYTQALAYSTICMAGLVFIYGYNIVSAVLRGMGDSRHPFIFISIAAVLNVALDILFVWGMDMGAGGAALATVISQGVSFIASGIFLLRCQERFELHLRKENFLRLDREMLDPLVRLGTPMAIKSASIMFSKLFVNSWINSYGVSVSAFAGIANKFVSISNLLSTALNTAGSSMVGQNIAARKYDRVLQIMVNLGVITFTMAAVIGLAIWRFPLQIFGIFTDEPAVLRIGLEYVPIAVLIFFGSAARCPMNALINGSGNYRINFATAILDGIIMRIGLALLFGLVMEMRYLGFWLGDAVAGFTPFVIGTVFWFSGRWKAQTLVQTEKQIQ